MRLHHGFSPVDKELELIQRYFTRRVRGGDGLHVGIGDDAALLEPPAGWEMAICVDTLVSGRHFPEQESPEHIAYKALAVNLSDLAAMGAEPRWLLLALCLPSADEPWLAAFVQGLFRLADRYRMSLVGGDLCRGPLTVSVTACGIVPKGQALRRDGARAGDGIYVTGTLGDAGLALQLLSADPDSAERQHAGLMQRLRCPQPRVEQGLALRDIASACIDLSDGLGIDLPRLLEASALGAVVDPARLPLSPALRSAVREEEEAWQLAVSSGDDYELCFTVAAKREVELQSVLAGTGVPCSRIGTIQRRPGLYWHSAGSARKFHPRKPGYTHFACTAPAKQ